MRDTHEAWTHTSAASIYTYMPFDAPSSLSEFLGRVEWVRSMPSRCVLAVFDKHSEGRHLPAGTISLANTDLANLSVELAPVVIFPDFQVCITQAVYFNTIQWLNALSRLYIFLNSAPTCLPMQSQYCLLTYSKIWDCVGCNGALTSNTKRASRLRQDWVLRKKVF